MGLRWLRAPSRGGEAPAGEAEKVATTLAGPTFFKKLFPNPPGGLVWGSGRPPGGLGRSGKAVLLGKLVDSMTWRISPTTKFGFRPVLFGSGSARLVPRSKNAQKTEDNARLDSKNAVFGAKMDDSRDGQRYFHPSWPAEWPGGTPTQVGGNSVC